MPDTSSQTASFSLADRVVADTLVVLAVAIWWLTSYTLPEGTLPSPFAIAVELGALLTDPTFLYNAAATAGRVVIAVVLATLIGSGLALLPRYVPWAGGIVDLIVKPVLSSFPSVGWAILGTIWFGVSGFSVLWIQTLILVPFCLINVSEGLKDIDQELIEMGNSFGRRKLPIFFRLVVPMLLPFVFSAARIAYGVGWKISLVAELFGARYGLGTLMLRAQEFGQTQTIMSICLAIVFFFFVGERLVGWLYRAITRRGISTDLETARKAARP